jgi:hypothetical protein
LTRKEILPQSCQQESRASLSQDRGIPAASFTKLQPQFQLRPIPKVIVKLIIAIIKYSFPRRGWTAFGGYLHALQCVQLNLNGKLRAIRTLPSQQIQA